MFSNLSNVKFLAKSEVFWNQTYDKYKSKFDEVNNEIQSKGLFAKESDFDKRQTIAKRLVEIDKVLETVRLNYVVSFYRESKFGVEMLTRSGGLYTYILKGVDNEAQNVSYNLFDFLHDDRLVTTMLVEVSASKYLNMLEDYDSPLGKGKDYVKLAIEIRKEETKPYQYPVSWKKPFGFSGIKADLLWLYAGKCKNNKLQLVMCNEDGRLKFTRNLAEIHDVLFIKNNSYNSHYYPKNWIMGSNGVFYPIKYAKKKNISVALSIPNSMAQIEVGKINSLRMAFSHHYGYYDFSAYMVFENELHSRNNLVRLSDGEKVPSTLAVYVERLNANFKKSQCVQVDGVWELKRDCIEYDCKWYHKSTDEILKCNLCGRIHERSNFVNIGDSEYEILVCRSCNEDVYSRLMRLCYSTDVINYKGFGNTSMKINGQGVYVGLELETYADFNSANRREVLTKLNKFAAGKQNYTVATRDGSLSDSNGVEYIFRPEGLNHQKRNVADFIQSIGDCLAEDAGNGYGLHIHVSSHFLSEYDKIRIDNFVSIFEKYFREIGGRAETEYQVKKKIKSNSQMRLKDDSKYKMVNIGRNGTIEYRFPKSLVNEVHINMNLEMALAVTMYCKYHLSSAKLDTRSDKATALKGFIDYVSANKMQYPLLNAENNAKIKLDKLESYSDLCKAAIREKKQLEDLIESYTLAA